MQVQIKNTYTIEVCDLNDNPIRKEVFHNIVKTNAYERLCAGESVPATLCFGSGSGTPIAGTPNTLFKLVTSINCSISTVFNNQTNMLENTLSLTIQPEDQKGLTVTEIGVGASNSLWTHAMITDTNGQNITLVKGDLERWYITAKVYIDCGTTIPTLDPDLNLDSLYAFSIIQSLLTTRMGNYAILADPNSLEAGIQPIPAIPGINMGSPARGTASKNIQPTVKTFTVNYPTTTGNGWNVDGIGLIQASVGRGGAQPTSGPVTYPFSKLDTANSPYKMNAQPAGTGNGAISAFKIPLATDKKDSIKVYADGVLVAQEAYTLKRFRPFLTQGGGFAHMFKYKNKLYRWIDFCPGGSDYGGDTRMAYALQQLDIDDAGNVTAGKIIPLSAAARNAAWWSLYKSGEVGFFGNLLIGTRYDSYYGSGAYTMWAVVNPETGELVGNRQTPAGGSASDRSMYRFYKNAAKSHSFAEVSDDMLTVRYGSTYWVCNADGSNKEKSGETFTALVDGGTYPPYTHYANGTSIPTVAYKKRVDGTTIDSYTYRTGNEFFFKSINTKVRNLDGKIAVDYLNNEGTVNYTVVTEEAFDLTGKFVSYPGINGLYFIRPNPQSFDTFTVLYVNEADKIASVFNIPCNMGYTSPDFMPLFNGTKWQLTSSALAFKDGWYYKIEFKTPPADGVAITYDIEPCGITKTDQWTLSASLRINFGW